MGLDMYAYVANRAGQQDEYWDQNNEVVAEDKKVEKPREIAYWRKHPNLHGWMEQLWQQKGQPGVDLKNYAPNQGPDFNGIELELTWEDLDELERAVQHQQLPATSGFFFGKPADEHYYSDDLEFVKNARAELFVGLKVFYNSSW